MTGQATASTATQRKRPPLPTGASWPKIGRVLCEDEWFVAVTDPDEKAVGLWWKGAVWTSNPSNPDAKRLGFPNSFNRPTYFIVPDALAEFCLRFDWLLRRLIGEPW